MKLSSEIEIFPPESKPLGLSYTEWCLRWCKSVIPILNQLNAESDNSRSCIIQSHNNSKITFLYQTFESVNSSPHRSANLPVGSKIFMPIINYISVVGGKEKDERDLREKAKLKMDEVAKLNFFAERRQMPINLWAFRVRTPAFDIDLPSNNIFKVEKGKRLMLVDGYWIFFQSLVKNLSIQTYGECESGKTQIAVDYDIYFNS